MGSLIMSSRHSGGSRFPSAYGHTPSYRSYASIPDASSASDFTRDLTRDLGLGASTAGVSAFNRNPTSLLADSDLHMPLRTTGGTRTKPVTEYSADSMYKATTTGASGIPHTSYAHNTTGYSSENPYKNRSSSYSYNI